MAAGWGGRINLNRRSMNRDLVEGMTDGCLKKIVRDHGGEVEDTTAIARRELNTYYQFAEPPLAYHVPVEPFVKLRSGA